MSTRSADIRMNWLLMGVLLFLAVPQAILAQHGGFDSPATADRPKSQGQYNAEREQARQDEENRRKAAAAEAAELAEDQKVVAAGGIVRIKRSDEEWSGDGADFSQWYYLASDPTPTGYVLRDVIFHLVGDRWCGSWSECEEVVRTADYVTWRFRMQGHSENRRFEIRSFLINFTGTDDPNDNGSFTPKIDFTIEGRAATSVGILKTRYVKAD